MDSEMTNQGPESQPIADAETTKGEIGVIQIRKTTRVALKAAKITRGESYDEIILRLLANQRPKE